MAGGGADSKESADEFETGEGRLLRLEQGHGSGV